MTSSEIWECLNTTYHALSERERAAKRLGPHDFLSFIERRAAMFAGLADSTLSRDDGYRFMVLGRAIERVDMTVRLLLSRVGDSASSPAWVTLLRSAGAHDTYLRTYRGVLDAGRVVEFMLLDRLFPRSVFYSLRLAEHNLDELLHNRQSRIGATAEAQRLLGQARSELEFVQPGVLLEIVGEPIGGPAAHLPRCRRGVGAAVLSRHAVGGVVGCRPARPTGQQERGRLMWRLRVVHTTGYAYQSPVTASYNEARLTPRSNTRQNVILNRVETIPATRSYRYIDYWGTAVTAFDLHAPHTDLTVTSSSVVETERAEPVATEVGWSDLHSDAVIDRFDDLLRPTEHTPTSKRVASVGKKLSKTHGPAEAVVAAVQLGARRAGLPSGNHQRALVRSGRAERGQGCLPGLRAPVADVVARHGNSRSLRVGLPASQTRRRRRGHRGRAKPRLDRGLDGRWWSYDPTNDAEITEQYVSVGAGRDYADVSPLKGIYSGKGATDLDVTVEVTRLA